MAIFACHGVSDIGGSVNAGIVEYCLAAHDGFAQRSLWNVALIRRRKACCGDGPGFERNGGLVVPGDSHDDQH